MIASLRCHLAAKISFLQWRRYRNLHVNIKLKSNNCLSEMLFWKVEASGGCYPTTTIIDCTQLRMDFKFNSSLDILFDCIRAAKWWMFAIRIITALKLHLPFEFWYTSKYTNRRSRADCETFGVQRTGKSPFKTIECARTIHGKKLALELNVTAIKLIFPNSFSYHANS